MFTPYVFFQRDLMIRHKIAKPTPHQRFQLMDVRFVIVQQFACSPFILAQFTLKPLSVLRVVNLHVVLQRTFVIGFKRALLTLIPLTRVLGPPMYLKILFVLERLLASITFVQFGFGTLTGVFIGNVVSQRRSDAHV